MQRVSPTAFNQAVGRSRGGLTSKLHVVVGRINHL
jgi:hypothetical protein